MTRFRRQRLRVVAIGLIATVLLAASFLQSASSDLLRDTLDANWRGSYDILVTAQNRSPLVGGNSTLLSSTSLTDAGMGHIPSQLATKVSELDGVDVAAPIGAIATRTEGTAKATLTIPLDGSSSGPHAYRADTVLTINDGVSEPRTITNSVDFVVDQSQWQGFQTVADGDLTPRVATSRGEVAAGGETDPNRNIAYTYGGYDDPVQPPPGQGVVAIALPVPVVETAHIVLVDPVAEKKLLGEQGDVMDPLIDTSALIGYYGSNFYDPANPPAEGDDLETLQDKGIVAAPTPVLTRDVAATPADLTVRLASLDVASTDLQSALVWPGEDGSSTFPTALLAGSPEEAAATIYEGQPGDALSPLTFDTVDVSWPGFTLPSQPDYAKYPLFRSTGSPILGFVDPLDDTVSQPHYSNDDSLSLDASGVDDGELLFNKVSPIPSVVAAGLSPYETATWPVGSFTPSDFQSKEDNLGQLGLGYDTGEAQLTPTSSTTRSPSSQKPSTLPPSWSGLGLDTTGALAVADLENAHYWHISDPVSSIRVRVASIDSYSPESQKKILAVADEVRALGLTATIVAGSSLESIATRLNPPHVTPGEASGPSSESDAAAPLVSLEYSRLGAVALAAGGVSGTNLALLIMAIVAGTALLVSVQLSSISARQTDSAVFRQIGWPRAQIRRWLLAEESVPLLILLMAGTATILISPVPEVSWPFVGIAVLASILTSALSVANGSRTVTPSRQIRAGARWRMVRRPDQLGLRDARSYWGSTVTLGLALVLLYAAVASTAVILIVGRTAAGTSRLGAFATAQAAVPQGVLIGVTITASCMLVVVVRRLGLSRRAAQLQALRAMGWQRRHLLHATTSEILTSALPGGIVGLILAVIGSRIFLPEATVAAASSGAAVVAGVTFIILLTSAASLRSRS